MPFAKKNNIIYISNLVRCLLFLGKRYVSRSRDDSALFPFAMSFFSCMNVDVLIDFKLLVWLHCLTLLYFSLAFLFFSISFYFFIFFALFAREVLFSISRLLPDVGNGGNGCIWYFYNHGYERHLLSTSQPYRANVNDSQLLCASRRCYRWCNRGIFIVQRKRKDTGIRRLLDFLELFFQQYHIINNRIKWTQVCVSQCIFVKKDLKSFRYREN